MKNVIVENVKVTSIPFFDKSRPSVQKCLEYLEDVKLGDLDLTDLEPEQMMRFTIKSTCSSFANALRRCIIEEIPVKAMSVLPQNIQTDDRFILYEEIMEHITSIPINQDIVDEEDVDKWIISINVHNKTENIINVLSNDIQISDGKKAISTKKLFSQTIPICMLHTGKFLNVTKMFIVTKRGYEDGKFIIAKSMRYKILDMEPFLPVKSAGPAPYQHTGTSSLEQDPTEFEMGYTTHRNIDAKHVMLKCCDALSERLDIISKHMTEFLEKKIEMPYSTDKISLVAKESLIILEMFDEYHTLSKAIAQYCFIVQPDIDFVTASLYHPLVRKGYVRIARKSGVPILIKAVDALLKDIATVRDAFKAQAPKGKK